MWLSTDDLYEIPCHVVSVLFWVEVNDGEAYQCVDLAIDPEGMDEILDYDRLMKREILGG